MTLMIIVNPRPMLLLNSEKISPGQGEVTFSWTSSNLDTCLYLIVGKIYSRARRELGVELSDPQTMFVFNSGKNLVPSREMMIPVTWRINILLKIQIILIRMVIGDILFA